MEYNFYPGTNYCTKKRFENTKEDHDCIFISLYDHIGPSVLGPWTVSFTALKHTHNCTDPEASTVQRLELQRISASVKGELIQTLKRNQGHAFNICKEKNDSATRNLGGLKLDPGIILQFAAGKYKSLGRLFLEQPSPERAGGGLQLLAFPDQHKGSLQGTQVG